MDEKIKKLFTPFNIGKEKIKNRFVVAPMGVPAYVDSNGAFTERGMQYFVERAKGGFGLIYTGVMLVDNEVEPMSPPSFLNHPEIFYPAATRLNERLSSYGAKFFCEVGLGVGRNYPTFKSPSPAEVFGYPQMTSEALTVDEIHKKRDCVIKAAAIAKQSGFAGVDIHTLHWGYLLDQFVMSITNKREDEYGGTLENQMRLVKEIVDGIHQVCGSDYPVTMGLGVKSYIKALNKASLHGDEEAGRTLEQAIEIAKMLEEYGYAAIMTDTGTYDSFYYACPPCYMDKGHGIDLYEQIKKNVSIPIIARSKMNDIDLCADALEKGKADAFMFGRPSLADPYIPRKVESGKPEKIRPCIGCNIGCIGRHLDLGLGEYVTCAVNPRAFNEINTLPKKSIHPRKIAVVGGGAAGMEAAREAVECGHSVELFEKSSVLGGELNAAGAHAFKQEIHQLRDWYIAELKEKNVCIHMETEFTPEMADSGKFDTVILAVGASPIMPKSISGIEKAISAVELLEKHADIGENVVVVGGGMVGCETAVDLSKSGKKVTIVEALPSILSSEYVTTAHKMMLNDMIDDQKITVMTGHKIVAVTDEGAVVEPTEGGEPITVKADKVVMSIGLKPNKSMAYDLVGKNVEIYEIGSARRAGNVINAIHDAFNVVYNFD